MLDANEMARQLRDIDGDAEVTTSTVHYYTQVGILPPAIGRGRGAFTPEHLARLRVARQLRRQGRSLAEIRDELARTSLKELLAQAGSSEPLISSAAFVIPDETRLRSLARMASAAVASSTPRTLKFKGGWALSVPPDVADDAIPHIYEAVEKALNRGASKRPGRKGTRP
jgi:DNA-binding transcriptional MerR regulator